MKRISILWATLSLLIISCTPKSGFDDNGYSEVYPGIQLYNVATTTNSLALDGPEMAFRLAILLEEAEVQGLELKDGEIEWKDLKKFEYPYNDKDYNLKDFFFGSSNMSTITKDGDKYIIKYGDSQGTYQFGYGVLDRYLRSGSYTIDTRGVKLVETTSSSDAWRINNSSSEIKYGNSNGGTLAITKSINGYLWHVNEGKFGMASIAYECNYADSPNVTSEWSSEAELEVKNYLSLKLSDLKETEYEFSVKPTTGGTAINGLEMKYATGGLLSQEMNDVSFKPSASVLNIIDGVEVVLLEGTFSEYVYPAKEVIVTWKNGVASIKYNDVEYKNSL